MSDGTLLDIRTLAFGDLDGNLWANVWIGPEPFIAVGGFAPNAPVSTVPVAVAGSSAEEPWRINGEGVELTVVPAGEPVRPTEVDFDQLCRVQGRVAFGGSEHTIDAHGRRSERRDLDFGKLESLRDVCAWFPPGDGVALTALRPRKARGHGGDIITAVVFEPSGGLTAADPRLSTTYAADGSPRRAGLELWFNVSEDSDEQYPRRAAGEALGLGTASIVDGLTVAAHPFKWHSRGADGAGVYLLVRAT